MRWNESFTTLWKDCRNPGYTKAMVVHYKLKMIWCPNAKVGTTSMYDLFRKELGTGEHVRCIKEVRSECNLILLCSKQARGFVIPATHPENLEKCAML